MPPPHACARPEELLAHLDSAHARVQDGGRAAVRPAIAESWRRSRCGGVDAAASAAPAALDDAQVAGVRAGHPLAAHVPMLRELLGGAPGDGAQLMVVTDGEGTVLWAEGPRRLRRAADAIGLAEGFRWSESAIGTNGIGTALAAGGPQYVFAAEHAVHVLHRWSCAGAPVTDPDSGEFVGCLDVSDTVERLHPASVRLVDAVARLAETALAAEMRVRDERLRDAYGRHLRALRGEPGLLVTATGRVLADRHGRWRGRRLAAPAPGAWIVLPDGRRAQAEPVGEAFLLRPDAPGAPPRDRPLLTLALLGTERPAAWLDGRRVALSARHAEILALLALHPRGMSGERLALCLYGEDGSPVTVRAEMHRLRARLGGVVEGRPYRLECAVDADVLAVRRCLDAGDAAGAARHYAGALLPASDAPAIREERDELAVRVRGLLLRRGTAEALWTYARTAEGAQDAEVVERLAAALPPGDPRGPAVAARGERLREEF
ncbi:Acetoin dehydrogenase operon transcriptional activator AcoR [Actinomadura rubteroloni]|uniref:Acetoin dehydrogenase operon transcriptional activator AcoR n=1 Tax=Actinomadura rubteroloni TaxID=1926885 RepID=A0A2P4UEE5_9ACTN|nr:GAF domain-containing protein [Actinomadura rubteroloni]POM23425.1 Acetoin dehydrogenase operon transcriptional activator AcoR [Actinomadura rubteroloni]